MHDRALAKNQERRRTKDRAKIVVEAMRDIRGDVSLVGISNQGLFMPLLAAQRPVRPIAMLNA